MPWFLPKIGLNPKKIQPDASNREARDNPTWSDTLHRSGVGCTKMTHDPISTWPELDPRRPNVWIGLLTASLVLSLLSSLHLAQQDLPCEQQRAVLVHLNWQSILLIKALFGRAPLQEFQFRLNFFNPNRSSSTSFSFKKNRNRGPFHEIHEAP
jgi:hypothetical protein